MRILEINHCRKSFGSNKVLTDISVTVDEGQVVSIIGPSGSGKSTLLRCATLLETMDGGDLSYLGEKAVSMDADGNFAGQMVAYTTVFCLPTIFLWTLLLNTLGLM